MVISALQIVFHENQGSHKEQKRAVDIIQKAFGIKVSIRDSLQLKCIQKHDLYNSYADLMRHYTNAYIAFVRQDSKLADTTDFQ